jgi:pyruvate,water dikinase
MDISDLQDLDRKSMAIQKLIRACPLPSEVETLLFDGFDRLAVDHSPLRLAVRSSAQGEDLGNASFAGLYHTELSVDRDHLIDAYRTVLASKYSPLAISYRLAKGFRHEETEMCVGFLAMIQAMVSGVCYSQSIGTPGQTLDLIFASGSAKGIVDGTRLTTHLLISRAEPHAILRRVPAETVDPPLLTDSQALSLAAMSMRLEHHFGVPQDIEWSIDTSGTLYILQSRPISAFPVTSPGSQCLLPEDERLVLHGGVTGCPGVGCGPVHIVRTSEDKHRFPKQAVLVVKHPLPEWAVLLRRAVALVAETGSEAGHLATISREYGLPALLSLTSATDRLVNGEIVTVDSSNHSVYRGRIEELLHNRAKRPNPMDGSPVQRTLITALKLISPLHLTDPTSPDFQAGNCRSLHDITRFCHEQSVVEMFDFGKRYHFEKGTAKRLRDNLPLEWWVMDLGEGMHPRSNSRRTTISIDDIACPPMLAFWNGMHAVPWEGPPAADWRTMVSFLFHAAILGGLDPARSSALRGKNYFLISKNYCNLSLRLGYHYAMVEAMLGDRPVDRYITFRFKGGAAGEEQRIRRIDLLTDILEHFDYRIDKVGDALTARMERKSERFVADRLKVLGFLTIHTRQLDMALANAGTQRFFCDKFIHEIEEMLHHDQ